MKREDYKAMALQHEPFLPLAGDYWTPLCHYNYLEVTVHYTEELQVLHSHILSLPVMKTGENNIFLKHLQNSLFLLHSSGMIQIKLSDGEFR